MHFDDYHKMLEHVRELNICNVFGVSVSVYIPPNTMLEQGFFFSIVSPNVQRHSCDVQLRNGSTIKTYHMFVDTNLGWMKLCTAAHRALDATYRMSDGTNSDPIKDYDYHIQRKGYGRDTRYDVMRRPVYQRPVSAMASPPIDPSHYPFVTEEWIRQIGEEIDRDFMKHVGEAGLFRGGVAIPAVRAVCKCDIKDLLSNGHVKGCPEKKR